jgi:mannose-6-phosphate isomerase-like protein (cupin superfamily)
VSYPEPRYSGESGELNAVFRLASTRPDLTLGTVSHFHYLATHASTQGEFGLYRVDMSAQESGTGTHFHRTISESFFILSGTLRLFDGERWIDGNAGDFLHVPHGGLHAFRNESGAPVSMLMLFVPGAPREEYFESLPVLASLSPEERLAFFIRHDSYFTEVGGGPRI